MFLTDKENQTFRDEARIFYDEAGRSGVRPYTYYFHENTIDLHYQNAIDFVMRTIWIEYENNRIENMKNDNSQPKETGTQDTEEPQVSIKFAGE